MIGSVFILVSESIGTVGVYAFGGENADGRDSKRAAGGIIEVISCTSSAAAAAVSSSHGIASGGTAIGATTGGSVPGHRKKFRVAWY